MRDSSSFTYLLAPIPSLPNSECLKAGNPPQNSRTASHSDLLYPMFVLRIFSKLRPLTDTGTEPRFLFPCRKLLTWQAATYRTAPYASHGPAAAPGTCRRLNGGSSASACPSRHLSSIQHLPNFSTWIRISDSGTRVHAYRHAYIHTCIQTCIHT